MLDDFYLDLEIFIFKLNVFYNKFSSLGILAQETVYKFARQLPMTGFEPGSSDVTCNRNNNGNICLKIKCGELFLTMPYINNLWN